MASNSTQAERRRGLNGYGDRESRYAAFPRIAAKGVGGLTGVTPPSTLICQLGVGQFLSVGVGQF
jgi:hypothetical protein